MNTRPAKTVSRLFWMSVLVVAAVVITWFGWNKYQVNNLINKIPTPDLSAVAPMVKSKINQLQQELNGEPDSPYNWGKLAMNFHAHGYLQPALQSYAMAHKLDPLNFDWPYLCGILESLEGSPEIALDWFKRAGNIKKNYAPLYTRMGDVYFKLGDLRKSETAYMEALEKSEESWFIHFGLARASLALGRIPQAQQSLDMALNINPHSRQGLFLLSDIYQRTGKSELAVATRSRAAAAKEEEGGMADSVYGRMGLEGVSDSWFEKRGISYLKQKLWPSAMKEFLLQVKVNPTLKAFNNLSSAYYQMYLGTGGPDKNITGHTARALKLGDDLFPGQRDVSLALGMALSVLGEYENSNTHLEKTLEQNEPSLAVYTTLGINFMKMGKRDKAMDTFKEGLKHFPGNKYFKQSLELLGMANAEFQKG